MTVMSFLISLTPLRKADLNCQQISVPLWLQGQDAEYISIPEEEEANGCALGYCLLDRNLPS